MADPVIRSYRDGDEEAILRLFHHRFHPHRTREHWRWKFRDHPWGTGLISVAVDREGDVICHCGGYPVLLANPGMAAPAAAPGEPAWPIPCLHVGDVMADRRALRGGLGSSAFESTLRHLHEQAHAAGMQFTFGAVAEKSDAFYARKMARGQVGPIVYRFSDAARLEARLGARGTDAGHLAIEQIDRAGPEFDDLFRRAGASYGVLAQRDAKYVDWRYCRCPDGLHRVYAARSPAGLLGWAAFRRDESRLVWGDAFIDRQHPEVATLLLARALSADGEPPVQAVEAWFPRSPRWWDRLLEELGFEVRTEPSGLRMIYICVGPERRDERRVIERLYYTMGDTDLF